MKAPILIALTACLGLAACASDHIVVERGSVIGIGATGKPSGAALAAIGFFSEAAAAVPYVNKKTGQQYVVPGPCGGFDAVSVAANVNGVAGGGQLGTAQNLSVTDDLAVGEPAKLAKLAAMQAAAPGRDILGAYRDCRNALEGAAAATAAAGATSFAPAARAPAK